MLQRVSSCTLRVRSNRGSLRAEKPLASLILVFLRLLQFRNNNFANNPWKLPLNNEAPGRREHSERERYSICPGAYMEPGTKIAVRGETIFTIWMKHRVLFRARSGSFLLCRIKNYKIIPYYKEISAQRSDNFPIDQPQSNIIDSYIYGKQAFKFRQ